MPTANAPTLQVSNVDQLRARIDSGRTGDKVPFSDPAAAPLGTDAEAAGHPPTRREIRLDLFSQAGSPISSSWPRETSGIVVYCIAVAVIAFAAVAVVLLG